MQATVDISKAKAIQGWMSERELLWLAYQASQCRTIVEFGSFHGRSTRALADNIQDGGTIWAVDPWSGTYPGVEPQINTFCMPEFIWNLNDHIITGRVVPIRGYSQNFNSPFLVDMIFIDGDHRYHSVVRDIIVARELVKSGGIISGHDYDDEFPGVKEAVDKMLSGVQVEDTIWWIQKS